MSFEDRIQPVLMTAEKHAGDVDREGRFPAETVSALRQSGMLGLTLPTSVGGLGATPTAFLAATRSLASRCASSAMVYLMHVCAAQVTLAGTPSGHSAELRAMADGSNLSTLAFSERGSRSHFWAPVSRLTGDTMSAEKSFVTSAGHADSYVVSTRPDGAESPIESNLYLVPASAPGIEVGDPWSGLGAPRQRERPDDLRDRRRRCLRAR